MDCNASLRRVPEPPAPVAVLSVNAPLPVSAWGPYHADPQYAYCELGTHRHRAAREGFGLRQRRLEATTRDRSRLGPLGSLSAEFHPIRLEGEVDAALAMAYEKSEQPGSLGSVGVDAVLVH